MDNTQRTILNVNLNASTQGYMFSRIKHFDDFIYIYYFMVELKAHFKMYRLNNHEYYQYSEN